VETPDNKISDPITENWFDAYAGLMPDAYVGKLFRGIIHNLNGIVQAFSMQSELFGLMFQQSDRFLAQIVHGNEQEKEEATAGLRDLLAKRRILADQMAEKVNLCQQIVQRTLSLLSNGKDAYPEAVPFSVLLDGEIALLAADPYFKHKVAKELHAAMEFPVPSGDIAEVRLALQVVLENALDAVRDSENPSIDIRARQEGEKIIVEIEDNGRVVSRELTQKIFDPFVSDKQGHVGLGLFIARRALGKIGGQIHCENRETGTAFVLSIRKFLPSGSSKSNSLVAS